MHEQSETIQDASGRWINVYGRGTPKAGQPLPSVHDFEQDAYDTVDEAVAAAKKRSQMERSSGRGGLERLFGEDAP